jgi:tetratricopeptide (TPR) repeat protein
MLTCGFVNMLRFWKVLWIDSTSAETIELSLQEVAGDPEVQVSGVDHSAQSVLQWLSHIEHDWLLIFDNADGDPRVVAKYMPTGNRGNIMFTSRNPGIGGSNITRETSIKVEDMGKEDAISLLLKSAWLDESSPEMRYAADSVVNALCFFPLAIDQAGAAIRSGLCTLDDYLTMYSEHRQRLMSHSSYEGASNYGRAAYATWDLSFAAIEARTAGSDSIDAEAAKSAIAILQTFAFLHHDNITEEIVKRAAEAPRKSEYETNLEDPARQASYDFLCPLLRQGKDGSWDPLFFRDGIRVLLSFSFIRQSVAHHAYSVHPLVHFWSHDRMPMGEQQSRCLAANILLSLSITFEFATEDYAFRRTITPHIKASYIDSQVQISIPYHDDQYTKFGLVLWENRFLEDAEKLQVQVMETRIHILGVEHPDTLGSMNALALTYYQQKRLKEAEKLQVQVMEMSSQIFGAEHPNTLISMGNLASTYRSHKQWKEATKLQVQVMEMMSHMLGAEHPDTLKSMGNLASTYRSQKQWKEAEKLEVQVMEMRNQILGAKHPDTLISMKNLGLIYHKQNRWKEAEKLQMQVIKMMSHILGAEHPDTLKSMGNLASTYRSQKQWEEAERLQVQVIEMMSQILGAEHPDTLTSMTNLAGTYWDQGWLEEAEKLDIQVMETRMHIFGVEHPSTLTSMVNLAHTWRSQRRDEEAITLLQRAVILRIETLGQDHPDTIALIARLKEWQK